MQTQVVTAAVQTLRTRGERISVRAVHGLTGGSFRDVSRMLRSIGMPTDEDVTSLEADASVSTPPTPLGQIAAMFDAARASEQAAGEASVVLEETRERLRALRGASPLPTDPHRVASAVAAHRERQAQRSQLQDTIQHLEKLIEQHMTEARRQQFQAQQLEARAHELRRAIIPSRRRDLAEAQHLVVTRERDLAHQVQLARRHAETVQAALDAATLEWQRLTGGAPEEAV